MSVHDIAKIKIGECLSIVFNDENCFAFYPYLLPYVNDKIIQKITNEFYDLVEKMIDNKCKISYDVEKGSIFLKFMSLELNTKIREDITNNYKDLLEGI